MKNGFTDQDDFKITLNDKEYPLTTREEKRAFALDMLEFISKLREEKESYKQKLLCIKDTVKAL